MRRIPWGLLVYAVLPVCAALWCAPSMAGAAESVGQGAEQETQVFRGDYEWNVDGHSNKLEATFRPIEPGVWGVTFDFKYARREGRYEGLAQGSLEGGSIHGEVKDASGIVRYRFEGEVEGDRLEGKHFNIYGGRKEETGWLRLERVVGENAE